MIVEESSAGFSTASSTAPDSSSVKAKFDSGVLFFDLFS